MAETATNLESLAPPAELRRMAPVPANRSLGWLTDKLTAFNEGKTPRVVVDSVFAGGVLRGVRFAGDADLQNFHRRRRLGQ